MNRGTHPPENRDPEALERDIDRTRSSLDRTMDELESRLSPGQLVDQALSMGRQHGGELAANLGRSVENHPLPLLLTAVGIAWMMMSSSEPPSRRRPMYGATGDGRLESAKERLHGGVESARSAASAVGEEASRARHAIGHAIDDTVSHTGERVRDAGERMRTQGERMREGFGRMLDDQPLLVGAIGIAVGAALGAILPRTEAEDRLMGETSDSAARQLKERATEAYEDVRDRASEVMPDVAEAATARTGIGSTAHAAMPRHAASDTDEVRRDH